MFLHNILKDNLKSRNKLFFLVHSPLMPLALPPPLSGQKNGYKYEKNIS